MLTPMPPLRHETPLDPAVLVAYVGHYELRPGVVMMITLQNNQLYAQLTGQNRFPVHPEGERCFFYTIIDAQIIFDVEANGEASWLTHHQNGLDHRAPRIEA
ncbi:DUF3471 domain-containing protein [Paraburkholderia phenazinium]|nr:DUF3471 domain-containing protein [Paraburkholderia phenazinium]